MLAAKSLRKVYSSVVAVDGIALEVKRGEILGLIGPNGAGKTTTIRLILNIIQPDAGQILFDGKPFSPAMRNIIGYLPEERGLYRKNKLLNTILYFASLKGISTTDAKREAMRWLERFNLSFYADKKVEELSKGNQQKVQFIISVLHNPQLVILDEPFSGLDPVNQIILKDELMRLKHEGKAIIFSTHVMDQAEKLCDRICLINKGKVVLYGNLNDIKRQYGENTIYIEFEGDGSIVSSLAIFKKSLLYENCAELQLNDSIQPSEALRQLVRLSSESVRELAITRFEVREPSLESIFLEKVGLPSQPPVKSRIEKDVTISQQHEVVS